MPTRRHLQATGRDARGRKQYRYHPRFRQMRDEVKYSRLPAFAQALRRIRRRTAADVRKAGLPRAKVLAAAVQLLEKTLIRIGNEEYARANGSIGLTTMHDPRQDSRYGCAVQFAARRQVRRRTPRRAPRAHRQNLPRSADYELFQ
jgi:DNA topoisomerase-1